MENSGSRLNNSGNFQNEISRGSSVRKCSVRLQRMDETLLKFYLKKYGLKIENYQFPCDPTEENFLFAKKGKSAEKNLKNTLTGDKTKQSDREIKVFNNKESLTNSTKETDENTKGKERRLKRKKTVEGTWINEKKNPTESLKGEVVSDNKLKYKQAKIDVLLRRKKDSEGLSSGLSMSCQSKKLSDIGEMNFENAKRMKMTYDERSNFLNKLPVLSEIGNGGRDLELVTLNDRECVDTITSAKKGFGTVTNQRSLDSVTAYNEKNRLGQGIYEAGKNSEYLLSNGNKNQTEEYAETLKKISNLIRRLHDSYTIIQQLKGDMEQNINLEDHFKKVIIIRQEKYRNEMWKYQETILHDYDFLLNNSPNPSDVTLEISKITQLGIDDVNKVISRCILVEDRWQGEKEKNLPDRFAQNSGSKEFYSNSSNFLKQIQEKFSKEINNRHLNQNLTQSNILIRLLKKPAPVNSSVNYNYSVRPAQTNLNQSYSLPSLPPVPNCQLPIPSHLNVPSFAPNNVYYPPVSDQNISVNTPYPIAYPVRNYLPPQPVVNSYQAFTPPSNTLVNASQNVLPLSRSVNSTTVNQSSPRLYHSPSVQKPHPPSNLLNTFNPPLQSNTNLYLITSPSNAANVQKPFSNVANVQEPSSNVNVQKPSPHSGALSIEKNLPPSNTIGMSRAPQLSNASQSLMPLQNSVNVPMSNFTYSMTVPVPAPPLSNSINVPMSNMTQSITVSVSAPLLSNSLNTRNSSDSLLTRVNSCDPSLSTFPPLASHHPSFTSKSDSNDKPNPDVEREDVLECNEVRDPTVPQKLMMKNQRFQAGDIICSPIEPSKEEDIEVKKEDDDEVQFIEERKTDKQSAQPVTRRVVLCALAQCMNVGVKICKGCTSVIYCSDTCQSEHWDLQHKEECDKLNELRGQ